MKKQTISLLIGILIAVCGMAEVVTNTITDAVDASGGWTLVGNVGALDVKDQTPTAGDSYFNFSINPGTTAPYGNRATVKDLGITLQAGATYTITGDFNQSFTNRMFIGDAFSTATSDQVAFGLFVTNGINFALNNNTERAKILTAINDILLEADGSGNLTWISRSTPDGTDWQTWSYTFTVALDSVYAGQSVWFGIYGGHNSGTDSQNSLAFDNLIITEIVPEPATIGMLGMSGAVLLLFRRLTGRG